MFLTDSEFAYIPTKLMLSIPKCIYCTFAFIVFIKCYALENAIYFADICENNLLLECKLHYRHFPKIKLWLMMRGQLVFAKILRDLIKFDWCFPTANMQQYYILKNKPCFENIYWRLYICCLFWSQKEIWDNKITIKTTANIHEGNLLLIYYEHHPYSLS